MTDNKTLAKLLWLAKNDREQLDFCLLRAYQLGRITGAQEAIAEMTQKKTPEGA